MKKLFALILALLLISSSALAGEDRSFAVRATDIAFLPGDSDEVIDLGFELLFNYAVEEEGRELLLTLLQGGEAAEALMDLSDTDGILLYLSGMANAYRASEEALSSSGADMAAYGYYLEYMQDGQFQQGLIELLNRFLEQMEFTEQGKETVSVLDEETELTRMRFYAPPEALDQLRRDALQFLSGVPALGELIEEELDDGLLEDLPEPESGLSGFLWTDDQWTKLRVMIEMPNVEYDMPSPFYEMTREEGRLRLRISWDADDMSETTTFSLMTGYADEATGAVRYGVATQTLSPFENSLMTICLDRYDDRVEGYIGSSFSMDLSSWGMDGAVNSAFSYKAVCTPAEEPGKMAVVVSVYTDDNGETVEYGLSMNVTVEPGTGRQAAQSLDVPVLEIDQLTNEEINSAFTELDQVLEGIATRLYAASEGLQRAAQWLQQQASPEEIPVPASTL